MTEIQCNREQCGFRVCEGYKNLVCPYCLEPFKHRALEAIIDKHCGDCDACDLPKELREWYASKGSCAGCKFEHPPVSGRRGICLVCSRKWTDKFERIDT